MLGKNKVGWYTILKGCNLILLDVIIEMQFKRLFMYSVIRVHWLGLKESR